MAKNSSEAQSKKPKKNSKSKSQVVKEENQIATNDISNDKPAEITITPNDTEGETVVSNEPIKQPSEEKAEELDSSDNSPISEAPTSEPKEAITDKKPQETVTTEEVAITTNKQNETVDSSKDKKKPKEKKSKKEKEIKASNDSSNLPIESTNTEVNAESKLSKKELRAKKRAYASVMSTGSYVKAFVLMLIPGINIICVILWALGAAKNRNKVHFSRACIIFFLIEILLSAVLFGAAYIYADQKEANILKYADNYTNGLLTYFDVDTYKDVKRLKNIPDYLVEKKDPNEKPVEIPKTRFVINPEEITSYQEFLKLYEAQYNKAEETTTEVATTKAYTANTESTTESTTKTTKATTSKKEQTTNTTNSDTTTVTTAPTPKTLNEILIAHNVDVKKSGLVYIIIEKENTIIAFDPTGKLQAIPSISINNEIIYIGGAK